MEMSNLPSSANDVLRSAHYNRLQRSLSIAAHGDQHENILVEQFDDEDNAIGSNRRINNSPCTTFFCLTYFLSFRFQRKSLKNQILIVVQFLTVLAYTIYLLAIGIHYKNAYCATPISLWFIVTATIALSFILLIILTAWLAARCSEWIQSIIFLVYTLLLLLSISWLTIGHVWIFTTSSYQADTAPATLLSSTENVCLDNLWQKSYFNIIGIDIMLVVQVIITSLAKWFNQRYSKRAVRRFRRLMQLQTQQQEQAI
jgi:hypothetical protein